MKILVLNSGSSSQKTALFELGPNPPADPIPPLWDGKLQWDGAKEELHIRNQAGKDVRREGQAGAHDASVKQMIENIWLGPAAVLKSPDDIAMVGHRVVHGGPKLTQPVRINSEVKREIESVAAIAPLHNQGGLAGIALIEKILSRVPQVAVFDTGFHRTLPREAFIYAVPYNWYESDGIRRYGFHGINHEYCARRAAQLLGRDQASLKIITCHLGNGCSLCAIDGGKSVDTTMGFTPLEGLVMGTRSGSVDPGILIHLLKSSGRSLSAENLDHALNHESGLLGVSGFSSDMRDIIRAMKEGNDRARLAFDIFVHRLRSGICAMAASLGGVDVVVFTAGIGENSPEVRQAACANLSFLGLKLEPDLNFTVRPDAQISHPQSAVKVLVIRAQEDWAIARECLRCSPVKAQSS